MEGDTAVFVCADDGSRLKLRPGKYSAFYACPLYDSEKHCTNRLSMKEADAIIRECEIPGKLYYIQKYQVFYELDHGLKIYYVRRRKQ